MKKFFTLLIVLTGCVMTASAWTRTATLKGSFDSWGAGVAFTNISENEMFVKISGSFIHSGVLSFKPVLSDKSWRGPDSNTDVALDGSTLNWTNSGGSGDFTIQQNTKAADIYIYIRTNDNPEWWGVTALVVEEDDKSSYNVKYEDPHSWNGVSAYVYYNYIPLNGVWPGGAMTGSDPKYSTTVTAIDGARIMFVRTSDTGHKSSDYDLVNNGNYTYYGLQGITASISSVGYATFSSTKAVDFTDETTIEACKASVDDKGKITYTPVTSVAAGEGVLLRRADRTIAAASSVIPLNADQEISRNGSNDMYGITAKQKIAQSTETGYTNFVLAKPSDVLGFFKVNDNGSWCAAGTAYLKVANGNIPAPVTSRGFFALDDETTGIEAVNNVSTESANDAREYYNLNGQRVMNPSKGLYIVNGKKVIIK